QAAIAAHEQKIQAMSVAHANELKSWEKKYGDLDSTYKGEKIGGLFKGSKFIAEKIAIPADIVQARFGSDFKIEDAGKVVAYDSSGNKIFSRTKPGEPADFDEALEMLIEQYPRRDDILKGSGHSGDGARNGGGGPINGKKKSDFKSEKDRSAFVNEHGLDAYKALPA